MSPLFSALKRQAKLVCGTAPKKMRTEAAPEPKNHKQLTQSSDDDCLVVFPDA